MASSASLPLGGGVLVDVGLGGRPVRGVGRERGVGERLRQVEPAERQVEPAEPVQVLGIRCWRITRRQVTMHPRRQSGQGRRRDEPLPATLPMSTVPRDAELGQFLSPGDVPPPLLTRHVAPQRAPGRVLEV